MFYWIRRLRVWAAAFMMAAAIGHAREVAVIDYNWLQLPSAKVTALIGGQAGGGGGYGDISDFRWGDHVWIPNTNLTDNGAAMYWGGVRFDVPREVESVWVQWWAREGTGISNFYVDASMDGTNWQNIGSLNYGSMIVNSDHFRNLVDVTDTNCLYVRVRVEPGSYMSASAARGGPGLYAIEPIGDGTVDTALINWANKTNFNTVTSISGLDFTGLRFNDGLLFDDEGVRTGDATNWEPADYAQIDLIRPRFIQGVICVWDMAWYGTNFVVRYSSDGSLYSPVTVLSSTYHSTYGGYGAQEVRFEPVFTRYVRITDVTTSAGNSLLNQVLVHGVREVAGTVVLLR